MPDSNANDVFVSYAHDDRERVRPFVDKLKAEGLSVWWDTEIEIGSMWRDVILDRLVHAKSVCVVWSARSIASGFVCDEAQRGLECGILVPVLLDDARPPLGFGEVQFASLANPATADEEMGRIISRIRHLSRRGVDVPLSQKIDYGIEATRRGAREADQFIENVRARSDILRQNPGSEQALRDALRGVRQTYKVVIDAIDRFLAPLTAKSHLKLGWYKSIASGRMVEEIEQKRGHCKRITQIYIESGGLRDSLPSTVSDEAKVALDALIRNMAGADADLFRQMTDVGSALAKEGAVITNLLLAEQPQSAEAHLRQCASELLPLQQELSRGMGDVDRLMVDLGIDLSTDELHSQGVGSQN
jgi:hypothetical protein